MRALGRTLASRGLTFTDLGDGIEKLATGGLTQSEMERIRDAAYAKGVADTEHKHAEAETTVYGLRPDGSTDWEAIALYCQRQKSRLDARHHQFVDDMASRMTWGREPSSEKQGKYLLSLFRQVGGRIRMNAMVDEATVRQFIEIISKHAVELAKGNGRPGVLQLCCLSPLDEKMIPSRFRLDDVEAMVKAAVGRRQCVAQRLCGGEDRARRPARARARRRSPTPSSCSAWSSTPITTRARAEPSPFVRA